MAVARSSALRSPGICCATTRAAGGSGLATRLLLAPRGFEIVRLVADGLTDKEIGKQQYTSPRTVQNHLTHTREKTALRRRPEIARWAAEHAIASAGAAPIGAESSSRRPTRPLSRA
jgi:DNA-binding CsgD family transcriptional regulator